MVKKYNSKHWEQQLPEYKSSGMTAKEWCQSKGINKSTLFYWNRRLKSKNIETDSDTQWASLAVFEHSSIQALIVLKYGDFRIEINSGFDKTVLANVLSMVMELC